MGMPLASLNSQYVFPCKSYPTNHFRRNGIQRRARYRCISCFIGLIGGCMWFIVRLTWLEFSAGQNLWVLKEIDISKFSFASEWHSLSSQIILMDHRKLSYVPPEPIQLEEEDTEEAPTWASDVRVGECTIVTGDKGQRFACWNIVITTSSSSTVNLRKRYSDLDRLRQNLMKELPETEIPKLPPKRVLRNLEPRFLATRRSGIEWFLSCVLLDPTLANTKSVREFIVSMNTQQ